MTSHSDAEFMRDPYSWPGLFCPIKRWVDGQLQCAYLMDDRPIIYYGNIWMPSTEDRAETYASHEAIVAAGWKVD